MAEKKFSKSEALRFGWEKTKSNFGFLLGVMMVVVAVNLLPSLIKTLREEYYFFWAIIKFVFTFLGAILQLGLIKIFIKLADSREADFSDLFSCAPVFFKFLGGSVLYSLIVFVGLNLFIVPGIIWAVRFQFFSYLIVNQGLGPIEALKKSFAMTKGAAWDLFVLGLLLMGIILLGAIPLFVGLLGAAPVMGIIPFWSIPFLVGLFLVAVPVASMTTAFVYRRLLTSEEPSPAVVD